MIKIISKSLISLVIIFSLIVFYLSFFGINTKKFNNKIKEEVLIINKKINLELNNINLLLNPFNLSINATTQNPRILLNGNYLNFKSIKTNISLKSFINKEFSIDDLNISTKVIKLNDLVSLARSFRNSPELFVLDNVIKEGFITGDMNLNFDSEGKLKDDYQIDGFIKKGKLSLLNKNNIKNLDLIFQIKKNKYSLKKVKTNFNEIELSSPLIEIKEKNSLFFINGEVLTKEKIFDMKEFNFIFKENFKNLNIERMNFSSVNNFSFNINKRFKLDNLDIESRISLKNLVLKNNSLNIKQYLPNFEEQIKLNNHKIVIKYNKKKLDINGKGGLSIEDKKDFVKYNIIKENEQYSFKTNINLDQNPLTLYFLNYKKKEDVNSVISINGVYKKKSLIKFDLISFKENNNEILIKNLNLNSRLKILDIKLINLDYINNNKIKNKISLKKDKKNYIIKGKSFDATMLVDEILNGDREESSSLFSDINSDLSINIEKNYLDENTFVNNLNGKIKFQNNKIHNLNLDSIFSNQKKLTFTINTNENNEKITTLFSDYPKPLVGQYKFIKGFEEGVLDFYSIKKNGKSNSLLKIDNFKVQEVPVLAKLLTLASLQGIADLLTGEGIRFTDFEMKFSNEKKLMKIEEMYAIGPAISILMDGYLEGKKLISLRGTLVPATTINRTISSIPVIGKILVGKKVGEGVFGVSFKVKGHPDNLKTTVNPIKTLTPRFITRTLEKIKKN